MQHFFACGVHKLNYIKNDFVLSINQIYHYGFSQGFFPRFPDFFLINSNYLFAIYLDYIKNMLNMGQCTTGPTATTAQSSKQLKWHG